jgi:hypothetical protein
MALKSNVDPKKICKCDHEPGILAPMHLEIETGNDDLSKLLQNFKV